MEHKMKLTPEEEDILNGGQGDLLQKVMETLVKYGDVYGAECLVPLGAPIHMAMSSGTPILLKPIYKIFDQMIKQGIKVKKPFTVDPRPYDSEIPMTDQEDKGMQMLYGGQDIYENYLHKMGMKDDKAYSCTCYFDEIGNTPKYGDYLAWSESSAVVYSNSVIGARTNRTSVMIDLFSGILDKTPKFGFMTDEGRKADYIIDLKTSGLPRAQILGSAIGLKVMEQVPYIRGLDKYLGNEISPDVKDYLKDMGAATASNGAVALYHVDHLTPEAKKQGESLIKENAKVYVIDDDELERVVASYPILWKDKDAAPQKAFIGCPHLSLKQLENWTVKFKKTLDEAGKDQVEVPTIMTCAPNVIEEFKETDYYEDFKKTGIHLSYICPAMYLVNPVAAQTPIITNSNKLRTYSSARYVDDDQILDLIVKGGKVE